METGAGPFSAKARIVLASGSPRRRDLLHSAGLVFDVEPSRADEPDPTPGEEPEAYVVRAARAKGEEVAARFPDAVVIAADTAVVAPTERREMKDSEVEDPHAKSSIMAMSAGSPINYKDADVRRAEGGEILGKPEDEADAVRMLEMLSGRVHRVVTGCAIWAAQANGERRLEEFAVSTQVRMGAWPRAALSAYVATGEPMDKAGAYAIQGKGGFLVEWVEGAYTNVVGLPLARVLKVLAGWGVVGPCGEL